MANIDAPYGFRPVRNLSGGCLDTKVAEVDASGATFDIGDLLVTEADGYVTRAAASPADGSVIGVAAQPHTTGTAESILYWPGINTVFSAQTDNGTGTATAQACVGANLNLVDTAPSGGHSNQELDESSAAATATLPFRVLGLYKVVGNSFGEFNQLEVIINDHALRGGTGTGI